MATSNATPAELPDDASDPTVAAIRAVVDPLIENEKALAACYAKRTRLLSDLDRLGHDRRIIAGLFGDPIESGRNDPDTQAHGPAWDDAELARRCMAAEAAGALRVTPNSGGMMVFNAARLTDQLPHFHQALTEGRITWGHAAKMLDLTDGLPEEILPTFEAKVLPAAENLTSTQFLAVARKILERMHPVPLQERADAGFATRRVVVKPDADGMAWLNAYLKAEDAQAIYDRLTHVAAEIKDDADTDTAPAAGTDAGTDAPPTGRTTDQRRADAYRDLLLDGVGPTGLGHGIHGTVNLTVPALTLLDRSDEPAILEGYGPIDPETARRIAGTATSWTRILTHPETGCRLSVGREQYTPPADMRRYLQIRDQTCQGIGCNRRATLSEIDHTQPWNTGGQTNVDNLVHLCKGCHRLKHQSSFSNTQGPGGALTWTTPSGRKYTSAPAKKNPAAYESQPAGSRNPEASSHTDAPPISTPVTPSAASPRLNADDPPRSSCSH